MFERFCPHLSLEDATTCSLLGTPCFMLDSKRACALMEHYEKLRIKEDDPPVTRKFKSKTLRQVLKKWREYSSNPRRGGRSFLTSKPLEENTFQILNEELKGLDVDIGLRKKLAILGGISMIPDITIRKVKRPTTFISVKSWIGTGGSIRELMMEALFIKHALGADLTRVYALILLPKFPVNGRIVEIAREYLDGLYFVDDYPYIDHLIKELKNLYK